MSTNAPAVQTQLQELSAKIPVATQVSWLALAETKANTAKKMEALELQMQGYLLGWENMDVVQLQAALDKYETGVKEMPEIRKGFTRYLDIIGQQLMVIEKRVAGQQYNKDNKLEPIADHLLPKVRDRFLKLREEEEKKNSVAKNRNLELLAFKTHVTNEYIRLQSEYQISLSRTRTTAYTQALKDELTEDGLRQYVNITEKAMTDVQVGSPNKYAFQHHNKEIKADMDAIVAVHQSVPSPYYKATLEAEVTKMVEQFKLYWHDKKNAAAAATYITQQQKTEEAEVVQQATTTQQVNDLSAKGESVGFMFTPPANGVREIKRKYKIRIEDDKPDWAIRIVSQFLARSGSCLPRLSITKWGNLSVKQMAAALEQEEEQIAGFTYDEIKK